MLQAASSSRIWLDDWLQPYRSRRMGKKSRRKPRPDAQTAKKQADDRARLEKDIAATERITERFRSPAHYGISGDHAELLYDETESLKKSRALTLESDNFRDKSATMDEYYAVTRSAARCSPSAGPASAPSRVVWCRHWKTARGPTRRSSPAHEPEKLSCPSSDQRTSIN